MATKPLLPEVVAERAKAADEYRKAHQAAIDRIANLRAARLQRDASELKAADAPAPKAKVVVKRATSSKRKGETRDEHAS